MYVFECRSMKQTTYAMEHFFCITDAKGGSWRIAKGEVSCKYDQNQFLNATEGFWETVK